MNNHLASSFTEACVVRENMPYVLDTMARSIGAAGATLVHSDGDDMLSVIASHAVLPHVEAYSRGERPDDPRSARVLPSLSEGFRLDEDDFSREEIARDPFYQEFLRPRGFGWHACALLAARSTGSERIHLSFKRLTGDGHFQRGDLDALTVQLPLIRMAAGFALDRQSRIDRLPGVIPTPSRSMLGIDRTGKVSMLEEGAEFRSVLGLRNGRLLARRGIEQAAVDRMILDSLQGRAGACLITDDLDRRWALRASPSIGAHSDGALTSIASLSCIDAMAEPSPEARQALQALFGLSRSEANVAIMIGQGMSIADVAARLGVTAGTARNQLKSVFHKTRVSRQAELSALLARI